jgi:hypothetical protein
MNFKKKKGTQWYIWKINNKYSGIVIKKFSYNIFVRYYYCTCYQYV